MKDLGLTAKFSVEGGTEYACMSTSASKDVACNFAISQCPLVFKFVTPDFMSRGAGIAFLSVYESKAEVMLPKLQETRKKIKLAASKPTSTRPDVTPLSHEEESITAQVMTWF